MKTVRYPLPSGPDSSDTVCVSFRIPANPEYIAAANGAIVGLTKWWAWAEDELHRAKATAELMRATILPTLQYGPDCGGGGGLNYWKWNFTDYPEGAWAGDFYCWNNNPNDCALTTHLTGQGWAGNPTAQYSRNAALITMGLSPNSWQGDVWVKIGQAASGAVFQDANGPPLLLGGNTSATWYYVGQRGVVTGGLLSFWITQVPTQGGRPYIQAIQVLSAAQPYSSSPGRLIP